MILNDILMIFEQSLLYLPLLLGAYCSMSLMKVPNLSIESAFVFGAILATKGVFIDTNYIFLNFIIMILLSIVGGAIVGLVVSLIKINTKLSHLLSSIITIGIFSGINLYVLGSSHLSLSNSVLNLMTSFEQYPALTSLFFIIGIIVFLLALFFKTQLGVCCAIYGNNPKFFGKYHISSNLPFIVGMSLSNSLAGISGFLISQSNSFVDTSMGFGIILFCITSLILGRAVCKTNLPISLLIPIFGVFGYFCIQNLLLKFGFDLRYFQMIQAVIVLIKLSLLNNEDNNQLGL